MNPITVSLEFQTDFEAGEWIRKTEIPPFVIVASDHLLVKDCMYGDCGSIEHYNILEEIREDVFNEIRSTDS